MKQPTHPTLPCRGCQADCPNRSHCQGKPWRSDFQGQTRQPQTPRH